MVISLAQMWFMKLLTVPALKPHFPHLNSSHVSAGRILLLSFWNKVSSLFSEDASVPYLSCFIWAWLLNALFRLKVQSHSLQLNSINLSWRLFGTLFLSTVVFMDLVSLIFWSNSLILSFLFFFSFLSSATKALDLTCSSLSSFSMSFNLDLRRFSVWVYDSLLFTSSDLILLSSAFYLCTVFFRSSICYLRVSDSVLILFALFFIWSICFLWTQIMLTTFFAAVMYTYFHTVKVFCVSLNNVYSCNLQWDIKSLHALLNTCFYF